MTRTHTAMAREDRGIGAVAAALHMKLPPFWPEDPDVWFAQVEVQFSTRGITAQKTKYDHVVASLSPEFATEVRQLILYVPDRPYDTLKQQLIQQTSLPQQRRLQQVLHSMELGDRKPSQLLRRMRQLLGDSDTAAEIPLLREIFLQCLPSNVRMVVASSVDEKTLEEIAELADKTMDVSLPQVAAITPSLDPETVASRRAEVRRLTELFSTLSTRSRSTHPRSRSPSPHRRHFRSGLPPLPVSLCWYHRRFGD